MAKASQKKMEYIANYEADNYDKVLIRLPKGTKARVQATGETINGFVNRVVKAELDGPAPTPTQPQPDTTTATPPDDVLQVPLSSNMIHNIDGAIRCGYSSDRAQYAIRAINRQIQEDIAAEKQRRARPVYPPDDYYDD